MKTYLLIILSACTMLHTQTHAITARNCAIVGGVTVAAYLIGKGITHAVHAAATERYKLPATCIEHGSESSIRKQLATQILLDNETHYDATSAYRNYPLVQYKKDLDWYVSWLNIGRFFTLGTQMNHSVNTLIGTLNNIKKYIVTDVTYINERRAAQEREENRTDRAHVVVHHRI